MLVAAPAATSSFTVTHEITIDETATDKEEASLILSEDTGRRRKLVLLIRRSRLTLLLGSKRVWKKRIALSTGAHHILIKQRPSGVAVCLDMRELTRRSVQLSGGVSARFIPSAGIRAKTTPRVQRVGDILFGDNFAREEETPGLWEVIGGKFVVNASLNPGSSQSAFQFRATVEDGPGLAVAEDSYWFWDDYRVGVSAKATTLPSTMGLVFHYIDSANYHALKWTLSDSGGVVRLVRYRAGQPLELDHVPVTTQAGQWNRICVMTLGTTVRAFINGVKIMDREDPGLTGGRIGLYVEKSRNVYFDDVTVEPVDPGDWESDEMIARPFGPCEQEWSHFSAKRFSRDPMMTEWAQSESFWDADPDPDSDLRWFRSRLFHDARILWNRQENVHCHWPEKPVEIVLFSDPARSGTGYGLGLSANAVVLSRAGKEVARAKLRIRSLDSFDVSATDGAVVCNINGKKILGWNDPEPFTRGQVAMSVGRLRKPRSKEHDWRAGASVHSSHRLDYSFEHAPTAWEIQTGTWRGTHRWACVPRWSFLGGRGPEGGPGVAHGNAILWNRRIFKGDFDLELFLAPMEATPQRVHFSWPVALSVAFCADARNMDSGYLFYFGMYDQPSRLYRRGREVARWDGRLDTNMRFGSERWYRKVTVVWQHIRIQRRGKRMTIDVAEHDDAGRYVGLERAFSVTDRAPLKSGHVGLWTWGDNGLAIARATISFADSPGVAPVRSTSVERVTRARKKKDVLRVRNPGSGGVYKHDLISVPLDLEKKGTLLFAIRPTGRLSLSLLASIRGQTAEVVLSGPERYRTSTIPIGHFWTESEFSARKWRLVSFDFLNALRKVFPDGPIVIDRLCLVGPCETLRERAGLGVNRHGEGYDLANISWRQSRSQEPPPQPQRLRVRVTHHAPQSPLQEGERGMDPIADFEDDKGGWSRLGGWGGAALYRDPHEPAKGNYSLRLANQETSGPAGVWITRVPYNLADFPELRFDYRIPADATVNLIVVANGHWFEIEANGKKAGLDASWPQIGQIPQFSADGKWHHAHVDLFDLLRSRLHTDHIRIEALAWADSGRMTTRQGAAYWMDNFCRVPAVTVDRPVTFDFTYGDPEREITALSYVVDNEPNTFPPGVPMVKGAQLELAKAGGQYLHIRALIDGEQWTDPWHMPIAEAPTERSPEVVQLPDIADGATGPPPAPFVSYVPSDRLCRTTFEYGQSPEFPEQHLDEFRVRREAWIMPSLADSATGAGCVEILNLSASGFFSAFFRQSGWDPERWPRIAFDYKLEAPCALNLSMLVNEGMTIVEWTGKNRPGYFSPSVIGSTTPAVQDGEWHHTEFDLAAFLYASRYKNPETRGEIEVTELATWATYHAGRTRRNGLGSVLKVDNFTIFSPRGRSPAFDWRVHGGVADMKGYSYAFDRHPNTVPAKTVMTDDTSAEFGNVEPGTWYFHVRACDKKGRWGTTGRKRIEIR